MLCGTDSIFPINRGKQDCRDLHSWGPGMRQCYIIHYILRGKGIIESGNRRFYISAGQSFLICPYQVIRYAPDPDDPWEYVWVDFMGKDAADYVAQTGMTETHPVSDPIPAEMLLPYFNRLRQLDLYRHHKAEASALLLAILSVYADSISSSQHREAKENDSRLSEALTLIASRYHHPDFHAESISRILSVSRTTLLRVFRRSLNQSPGEYLQSYRLDQSCKMLRLGMSVKHTALSCGFGDPYYYSRAFKKVYGIPPSEYAAVISEAARVQSIIK